MFTNSYSCNIRDGGGVETCGDMGGINGEIILKHCTEMGHENRDRIMLVEGGQEGDFRDQGNTTSGLRAWHFLSRRVTLSRTLCSMETRN